MVKSLESLLIEGASLPEPWSGFAVVDAECMTYGVGNTSTREMIVVDPCKNSLNTFSKLKNDSPDTRWCAVIDTHTHADHVSVASELADLLEAPLVQHQASPCSRINLRVCRDTVLPLASGPLTLLDTPGHTADGLTVIWGPFILGGDTVLFGDTGRDDLPGGSPEAHFESVQKIKKHVRPEMLLLPGHDSKGGRVSTWAHQLKISPSLTQNRATFVREAAAFSAPAPKLFKESLFANFK